MLQITPANAGVFYGQNKIICNLRPLQNAQMWRIALLYAARSLCCYALSGIHIWRVCKGLSLQVPALNGTMPGVAGSSVAGRGGFVPPAKTVTMPFFRSGRPQCKIPII